MQVHGLGGLGAGPWSRGWGAGPWSGVGGLGAGPWSRGSWRRDCSFVTVNLTSSSNRISLLLDYINV